MSKNLGAEVRHYAKFLNKRLLHFDEDDTVSVIILAAPRTGSTLLSSYLGSFKNFKNQGEILNPSIYPFFEKVAKLPFGIARKVALFKIKSSLAEYHNSSVKLMFDQIKRLELKLQDIENHFPTAKFILIYRENLMDCYVSLLRAKVTQEWHLTSQKSLKGSFNSSEPSFYIDKEDFLAFCQRTKNNYIMCNSSPFMKRAIVVDYQNLIRDPQQVFQDTICPFLKIDFNCPKSSLRKQITKPLSEIVENFDELQDILNSEDTLLNFNQSTYRFY